jgi:hypothetical protein
VRRPCVECGAFLLCPIVPLIDSDYTGPTSAQMVQHRLGDFETHARRCSPVARVRRSGPRGRYSPSRPKMPSGRICTDCSLCVCRVSRGLRSKLAFWSGLAGSNPRPRPWQEWCALKIVSDEPAMCVTRVKNALTEKPKNPFGKGTCQFSMPMTLTQCHVFDCKINGLLAISLGTSPEMW